MSDVSYSKLRGRILEGLKTPTPVPITFPPDFTELIESLQLTNLLFTRVLSFANNVALSKQLDAMEKDGKVSYTFNQNYELIQWLICNGIVDSVGDQVFSEEDVAMISGKHQRLLYFLCWEILDTNDFTTKAQQATVKNSEGTQLPNG